MNYRKIYDDLINRARYRNNINVYYEKHHIIPKCIGGDDTIENIVKLTPEEHYIAHQLLIKIYPHNDKLIYAAIMMIPNRPSNKLYGWLRKMHSSSKRKLQTGKKNSQHNTIWINNKILKSSKKINKSEKIPEGWEVGRIINWDIHSESNYDICHVCKKKKQKIRKFCSKSCSLTFRNKNKKTIFDLYLNDMIKDYNSGVSIYKCLTSRNLCGTGKNFTTLKKIIQSIGDKSIGADTTL